MFCLDSANILWRLTLQWESRVPSTILLTQREKQVNKNNKNANPSFFGLTIAPYSQWHLYFTAEYFFALMNEFEWKDCTFSFHARALIKTNFRSSTGLKWKSRYPFQHCHPKMAVSKWSKYTVYISFLVDRNTTGN